MEPHWRLIGIVVASYLIGSFPTGLVVGKVRFGKDIRTMGSGNIGSTNVMRVLGFKWGLLVQIVDILKGVAAILVALFLGSVAATPGPDPLTDTVTLRIIAGSSAVIGHVFSAFTGFKGGKGVNTSLGMLLAIAPIDVGVAAVVFLLLLLSTGYVSLGSIVGAVIVPLSVFVRHHIFGAHVNDYDVLLPFLCVVAIVVMYAHRSNIRRLINGTENRFEKVRLFKR
ncbi:MAG: glycerol-3-phosphate 1-O-acyltransferase PlsY [Candidatus Kapabacteria bacterium]|nr:glycerol-3-phosphate 1-O-acyltransferase PlsY [Candidatus Kapabacteria bacterium]